MSVKDKLDTTIKYIFKGKTPGQEEKYSSPTLLLSFLYGALKTWKISFSWPHISTQNYKSDAKIVIFYTEILTRKVVILWSFFIEKNEKIHKSTSRVKNLSTEWNFFKWDGKVSKIWHLLFHRIWKKKWTNLFFLCRPEPICISSRKNICICWLGRIGVRWISISVKKSCTILKNAKFLTNWHM